MVNSVGKLKYKAESRRSWTQRLSDARRQILDAITRLSGKNSGMLCKWLRLA